MRGRDTPLIPPTVFLGWGECPMLTETLPVFVLQGINASRLLQWNRFLALWQTTTSIRSPETLTRSTHKLTQCSLSNCKSSWVPAELTAEQSHSMLPTMAVARPSWPKAYDLLIRKVERSASLRLANRHTTSMPQRLRSTRVFAPAASV